MIDLNTPATYLHWWVVQISIPNLIVIALMVAVFLAAIVVPLPREKSSAMDSTTAAPGNRPSSTGDPRDGLPAADSLPADIHPADSHAGSSIDEGQTHA